MPASPRGLVCDWTRSTYFFLLLWYHNITKIASLVACILINVLHSPACSLHCILEKKKETIVKITLLMPQSEMYRKRGIFSKALRYAPLTLTTLAALVPEELNAEMRIIDEGVEEVNIEATDADIVG